jgi:hypothetical protein
MIPRSHTAQNSPALSRDENGRLKDHSSAADTGAFRLIKRTFKSVKRGLGGGSPVRLHGSNLSDHMRLPSAFSTAGEGQEAQSGSIGLAPLRDDKYATVSRRHFLAAQQESILKRGADAGDHSTQHQQLGMFKQSTWDAGETSLVGDMVPLSHVSPGEGGQASSSAVVFVPRSV